MERSGRDPHEDRHGRKFTHLNSNVATQSRRISFVTCRPGGLDDVPALDLFGKKEIKRYGCRSTTSRSMATKTRSPPFQLHRPSALGRGAGYPAVRLL